jgi:hypothetical protein
VTHATYTMLLKRGEREEVVARGITIAHWPSR